MAKKLKTINPAKRLKGEIRVSPDKSISHRAAIFTSLASGRSRIKNFLRGGDCINTLKGLKKLGVKIKEESQGAIIVKGRGRRSLKKSSGKLYFGNSATGMRLMAGVLAGQSFSSILTGDKSLTRRPMRRITLPLSKMGARITAREGKFPPLKIKPSSLKAIDYTTPVASAQIKSCILLGGLYAEGKTSVTESFKSRDHTERMMKYFEIPVEVQKNTVSVSGGINWPGRDITVPGDFSSSAFFIAAALLLEGSELVIRDVNLNPTRTGFLKAAEEMGGNIEIINKKTLCGEPAGDLRVKYSPLKGITVSPEDIPAVIDEIPLLALLGTKASGKTLIEGAGELRKKETDRLHATSTQLKNMGLNVQEQRDSLIITGRSGAVKGARVNSFDDHRMAMMLSVAALGARGDTQIENARCVEVSFPDFYSILESCIER